MVYTSRIRGNADRRPRAFWGALIPAAINFVGGLITSSQQAKAQKRALEEQQRLAQQQLQVSNQNNLATTLNNYASAQSSYDDDTDYNLKYRNGGTRRLGSNGIVITDGGNARKIGNNTYLLRGGSHEDINETGQTGIGINVGGNEIEAEGGEVAQKKNKALRIFSAQPMLSGGLSPAQAVLRGYNKDKVFEAQQRFKRNNHLKDDGSKAKHGTSVPYKRIHINEDGTFTDTLTGKNYTTSATNGEDVVITGKANHWKEAGKKDTSSYFDPMGAVNFVTAAGAPILNANPSNIVGSIRDSKSASDFLKHYMMQDTGGFVNTEWAKEHPYLSLGINTIGDIGLGIGTNKAVDILRHPMNYGKYGYKLNKLYKKAGLLNRGEYKTAQENYEKLLDYYVGNRPYNEGALDYTYDVKASRNAERVNPDLFYSYAYPNKEERIAFKRAYRKKATDNVFTEMHTPAHYGFDFGKSNDVKTYEDLMNHNPEYYEFLKETRLPWDEQSTVDEFLKRQQISLRGVYADDKETAKEYLTRILAVRKGGDRLNTHGGLYTSNSTGIADAFKNPDNGISNGYIGKLLYNFDIDKTKPIADQLRQARMKIVRGGHNNVFAGSNYYDESINDARRKGAVAVEDNYGRSNGDVLNVTERAYFPGSAKQNKLTLQNLEEYLAQENQRGRWNTNGVDKMKGDEELFIPKQYNLFDDYIREARIFMKPRRLYDTNKSDKFFNELYSKNINRSEYRNKLIDMSRRLLKRNERNSDKFDVRKETPIIDFDAPFRFGGRCKLRNGGLTSKDRGSSKHPYPSVSSKDFAGGNRSYPIPTKADAIDVLRLAGLHGRSDVRSKVYSKYPELRKKAAIGTSIGINSYNTNIPDYTSTYINWLISQLPSEKNKQQVTKYNKEDINNAVNAANLAYQNYLIRQLPSGKSNKQEDNKQGNNKSTRYITVDELKRNTQSLVDASRRSVDFASNTYRSKLISQLQPEGKRSLKDKTQLIIDAAKFAVNNAINYRNSKLISQLPNKQDSKENNKKEKNKVVKHQVKTTPQYKGNTTKGNYQLHDGETKVINGVKYTRRGNTIINHKTNVGYIYDKNGNYTGQADYSKVGNFNQAFDAARAAGRNQFIYRAGKYNNYSTAKETNAKKEALNRKIGARRIAKRMGGLTNTPVGNRKKYLPGGTANPWDEYKVPDYGGTAPWQVSNKYDVNVPYPIGKYDLPITTITAKKDTFNDEMSKRMRAGTKNLSNNIDTNIEVPYLGRQNTFKPATQDYIGLGIDTLAALGSGLFTRSAYNKLNFDYALPNYVDENPVAFDTIYHNEAQRANVERNRLNSRDLIRGNTSSAQTALSRMQQTDTDAMMELNKLADEKANKEVELRNQNAANEQQVRARNAAARNQYYQNVAQIKNAALEAKNNAALAKAQSIGADLSGLSQAWTNFAGSVEQRYNTRQNEAIIAATSKEPAVLSNALQFGYNFSPEVLASIYRSTNDDKLKQLALSRLSPSDRRRYSLFQ